MPIHRLSALSHSSTRLAWQEDAKRGSIDPTVSWNKFNVAAVPVDDLFQSHSPRPVPTSRLVVKKGSNRCCANSEEYPVRRLQPESEASFAASSAAPRVQPDGTLFTNGVGSIGKQVRSRKTCLISPNTASTGGQSP